MSSSQPTSPGIDASRQHQSFYSRLSATRHERPRCDLTARRYRLHLLLVAFLLLGLLTTACQGLRRPGSPPAMARVYADVNQHMPRAYWDYDSVNISWGVLENYEVVRKIGMRPHMSLRPSCLRSNQPHAVLLPRWLQLGPVVQPSIMVRVADRVQAGENTPRFLRESMWLITRNASSRC